MAATVTESGREQARRLLADDFTVYAPRALRIITKSGEVVPFVLNRPQLRMALRLQEQRAAGQPMRGIALKARQVGMSTEAQGMLIQRTTSRANHRAMTVALDGDTSSDLFDIGHRMWTRLPAGIKPELAYWRNSVRQKYMEFGEPAAMLRRGGMVGLDSRLTISTANLANAGRGKTIRSLHMSEVAFWPDVSKKTSLLAAVPDDADTLVIEESTAWGLNHFKDDWDEAVAGNSGYYASFTPWFEDVGYRRAFLSEDEMFEFEQSLGSGRWGEDEPELLVLIPEKLREWALEWDEPISDAEVRLRTLEHLNWRRWAIAAKSSSSLDAFHQEYPSTPDEAFLSTGRKVFDAGQMRALVRRVAVTDPPVPSIDATGPAVGLLRGADYHELRTRRDATVQVPRKAVWVPRRKAALEEAKPWRLFAAPVKEHRSSAGLLVPAGQYIVSVDPMSGEENDGTLAEHSIQVINHRTLAQVAEYVSQVDPDEVAEQALLAALFFNGAWIVVERTGGWGRPLNTKLARDYRYPRLYEEQTKEQRVEHRHDRLGWNTDPKTKPEMEARAKELLRTGTDGIASRLLAEQMLTYIRDERGRTKPEKGKRSDRLMAWMIGQMVAQQRPVRPDNGAGSSSSTRRRRYTS